VTDVREIFRTETSIGRTCNEPTAPAFSVILAGFRGDEMSLSRRPEVSVKETGSTGKAWSYGAMKCRMKKRNRMRKTLSLRPLDLNK
jgi:hypothetical protein